VLSAPGPSARRGEPLPDDVRAGPRGVPVPPTTVTEDIDEAAAPSRASDRVIKPLFTSKGRGMRAARADSRPSRPSSKRIRDAGSARSTCSGSSSTRAGPRRGGARRPVLGAYWRVAARRAMDDDDSLRRPLREGEIAPETAEWRSPRRALRLIFTGVDLIEDSGRPLQRARGERVRRIPRPAERPAASTRRPCSPSSSSAGFARPAMMPASLNRRVRDASQSLVAPLRRRADPVTTNDPEIATRLASYFRPFVISGAPPAAEGHPDPRLHSDRGRLHRRRS
jgi:hypothetical protein